MKRPLTRIQEALARVAEQARGVAGLCAREARILWDRARSPFAPKPPESGLETIVAQRPPARVPDGRRVYAIGDIHGRADLLRKLLDNIQKDALGGDYRGKPVLVFLGDYVDRGMESKQVIDLLAGKAMSPFETHFLKGNHEAAMLEFLADPAIGPRWADYGGRETLASYGVRPPRSRTSSEDWALAAQELKRVLPPEHLDFLRSLELSVQIGDYLFVHAGIRPGVGIDHQSEHDMLWIRDEFLNDPRPLGPVVVHGHTPAPRPHRDHRRIGLDTGAYLTGKLTAARFEHDRVAFLSTDGGVGAEAVAHR